MSEIKHIYEVRPRKDKRGFDLISDALPFGPLLYGEPKAIGYAPSHRGRSHLVRSLVPSENFARRCKNEDSFGRAAETSTRTCEHNSNSAAMRESIGLPR